MNLREKLEYDQWQSERGKYEDDPAKEHRLSVKGVAVIQDEYFEDIPLRAFEKAGIELKETIEARKRVEQEVLSARHWLMQKGYIKHV